MVDKWGGALSRFDPIT